MKLDIGSVILSYDFPHMTDCFMVGRVTSIADGVISCDTLYQVSAGEPVEITDFNNKFRTVELGKDWSDPMYKTNKRIIQIG